MIKHFASLPLFRIMGFSFTPKLALSYSSIDGMIICEVEAIPKGKLAGTKYKSMYGLKQAKELRTALDNVITECEQEKRTA
ncbi:hypothetical protein [Pseudemcibacter aquimaris]|uniref:hypothetical protein n=1 Tax=Pseudemcibacter aquimaris TaxID=2857064 RepID=UPI0020139AC1|nr:hypothetical protein [Pseudemcibacter aquimaris]MCC3859765.1 hypothetical protein [Pseudemcibacter aquimaris]WDU60159.1 hypothetical protein KW060_07800 [Pseudemcibacter aquimaris]